MTNRATAGRCGTPGDELIPAAIRWSRLGCVALMFAASIAAQAPPDNPMMQRENPQVFHETVAIVVQAPPEVRTQIATTVAEAFNELKDTDVYVFAGKFTPNPNWVVSVSADVSGDKKNLHFVLGVAYSRAIGLLDPEILLKRMENKTQIPTVLVKQLIAQGMLGVSDFKALWVAEGSMNTELEGACKKAAALFDRNFLERDREAFKMRPLDQRTPRRQEPRVPIPH